MLLDFAGLSRGQSCAVPAGTERHQGEPANLAGCTRRCLRRSRVRKLSCNAGPEAKAGRAFASGDDIPHFVLPTRPARIRAGARTHRWDAPGRRVCPRGRISPERDAWRVTDARARPFGRETDQTSPKTACQRSRANEHCSPVSQTSPIGSGPGGLSKSGCSFPRPRCGAGQARAARRFHSRGCRGEEKRAGAAFVMRSIDVA
jgi:hypothetical protein